MRLYMLSVSVHNYLEDHPLAIGDRDTLSKLRAELQQVRNREQLKKFIEDNNLNPIPYSALYLDKCIDRAILIYKKCVGDDGVRESFVPTTRLISAPLVGNIEGEVK